MFDSGFPPYSMNDGILGCFQRAVLFFSFSLEPCIERLKRVVPAPSAKGRCESTVLSHAFTDVAQVADAARNLEILRDRDDYDRSERSDKRHKSGDRYQSATQQNSYRGHDQKNDRQGSDRQGGGGNYRNNNNNNYSRDNNRNSGAGRDQEENRGSQHVQGTSEGIHTMFAHSCGRRPPRRVCRAAGTCFKCGQAGHLSAGLQENTGASSCWVMLIKEARRILAVSLHYSGSAANTSGTSLHTVLPIDCHSVGVIFGDISCSEVISHGSLPRNSHLRFISALKT
ncbi:hypothetical protein Tco_1311390 [Tanacetum coccineum]